MNKHRSFDTDYSEVSLIEDEYKQLHWLEKISYDEKMTLNSIATNCGISRNSFYSILNRKTEIDNVKVKTIEQLSHLIGCSMEELLIKYRN